MASLSDDTLRKILVQIERRAIQSQRDLNTSRQQVIGKERDRKRVQLTREQLSELKDGVNMYEGVGKMFIEVPREVIIRKHKKQEAELGEDITNLEKKMKYLEKQSYEAQAQLRDIFHSAPQP